MAFRSGNANVGALVVTSRRASQSRTRRRAVSQFFSSVAAISRLSGSQGGVAALGERRLVARLLELKLKKAAMFGLALHLPQFRQLRCLDRHGLDGANELASERRIDVKAAEHHTPGHAERGVAAIASIDGAVGTSGVNDGQPTAAAAANQEAAEQGAAAAAGLRTILATVGVGGDLRLIAFKLLPADVAFVMVLQQDLAVLERTIVPLGFTRTAINDLGSMVVPATSSSRAPISMARLNAADNSEIPTPTP